MPENIITNARAAMPFGIVADSAIELVKTAYTAASSPRGMAGVPTGFPTLDKSLSGLQTGLHILGAEPGAGKTALALNIARNAVVQHGLPVVYASFDETPERLALKVLAAHAGLTVSDILGGSVNPDIVVQAVDAHREKLASLTFVAADAGLSPTELIDQLQDKLKYHRQNIGLLVVDYFQVWAAAFARDLPKGEFRLAIGQMALQIRELSNKTKCPVLLISAQNRSGQGSDKMTSLRESSDLEYGADSIMLLTNDETAMPGSSGKQARFLTIAKNRFGSNGVQIGMVLDGRTQMMIERK